MKSVVWFAVLASLLNANSAMAGDVQASIRGGSLYIYGDAEASSILVDSPVPNRIRVRGRIIEGQPTTVNSKSTPVLLSDWTGGIFIYLYEGSDAVEVQDVVVNGTVHIDVGGGSDDVILGHSLEQNVLAVLNDAAPAAMALAPIEIDGGLVIITADGNDYTQIDNTNIEGRATVDTGAGFDEVYVADVNCGDTLAVYPGSGSDVVDIFATDLALDLIIDDSVGKLTADVVNANTGRNAFIYGTSAADIVRTTNFNVETLFQVFTEGANDTIALGGRSRTLEVYAGSGYDRAQLTAMTSETTRVFLDGGVDSLVVEDSDIGLLNAYGGADNDTFTLRTSVIDTANIYGDGGTDTFRRPGSTIGDLNLFSIENQ